MSRAVRQQLESFAAAGMTHIPRRVVPATVADGPAVSISQIPKSEAEDALLSSTSIAMPKSSPAAQTKHSLFDEPEPEPVAPLVTPTEPLSRVERIAKLQQIDEKVKQCTKCHELASTRNKTVFGVGDPEAKILFIGEAPGADEDAQGEPFVGRAGKLLTDIISACRMRREQVYICNILKCRPPNNRTPLPDECSNCRGYLDGQLATIDPEYIVCWGAVAAQNLLGTPFSIGKLRGRFFQHGRAKVLCTYHPSYLLRNPAAKKDVWDDMKFLFKDMGIDLAKK